MRRLGLVAFVASMLALWAEPLLAATTTYTGVYAGGTIAPGNTVVLNNGATVAGNVVANGTLLFNQSGTTLTVSSTISGTGTLSLTNSGTLNLIQTSDALSNIFATDLTTDVRSGSMLVLSGTGEYRLGASGTGTLNVAGGTVRNSNAVLGHSAGSAGVVSVKNGVWANNGYVLVGYRGTGMLNIGDGSVSSTYCMLGYTAGSSGVATVTGGTWSLTNDLYVGFSGTGALTMSGGVIYSSTFFAIAHPGVGSFSLSGGHVSNLSGVIAGSGKESVATATITGGTWSNNYLYVGASGTGTLRVAGGSVGVSSGTWSKGGALTIGDRGTGIFNLDVGSVSSTYGILGRTAGSSGVATVNGGTWSTAENLTVGGTGSGTLTMSGGVVIVGGTLSKGTYGFIDLNVGGTLQIGTGAAGGVLGVSTLTNNGSLIFNRSDGSTYSGVISGTGAVIKQGIGTLMLSGSNSYTGGTLISGGCITLGNAMGLGDAGRLIITSGTLDLNGQAVVVGALSGSSGGTITAGVAGSVRLTSTSATNSDYSGAIKNGSGVIAFVKQGTGTLTLSGSNSYTGGTEISGGLLQIGVGGTTGSIVGNVVNNSALIFNRSDGSTYSGVISGTGAVIKQGIGTLMLSGSNSYTGGTTISGGRLALGNTNGLAVSGAVTITNGVLDLNGKAVVVGELVGSSSGTITTGVAGFVTLTSTAATNSNYAGAITNGSGMIALTKQGAGTLTLSGTCSYTGGTTIREGTVAIPVGGSISHGSVDLTIGHSYGDAGTLAVHGGSVTNGHGRLGLAARSMGTATVTSGTWTNSGNLYVGSSGTGMITMSGGLVTVGGTFSSGSFGTVNLNPGGTLQIGTGGTTGVLAMNLTANGTLVFNRSNASTYSLVINGTGAVVKRGVGTLTLSGSNTYTGPTTIVSGTLQIGSGGTSGAIVGNVLNNSTLVFNRSNAVAYPGVISGSGKVIKNGVGLLAVTGSNTLTGSTTIQQGTLQLAHASALFSSTISPLAGGVLSLTPGLQATVGGLKPNAGGLIDIGTGQITVASGLSVADLAMALESGRGDGSWNGPTGITSSAIAASNGSRTVGWLDNGDGSVTVGYAAAGDTNLDWSVDILDLSRMLSAGKFNSDLSATWAEGDFTHDGVSDILDISRFISSGMFNAGPYNAPAGTIAAVPEPSVTSLVGAALGIAAAITAVNQVRRVAGTAAARSACPRRGGGGRMQSRLTHRSLAGMSTSCP